MRPLFFAADDIIYEATLNNEGLFECYGTWCGIESG